MGPSKPARPTAPSGPAPGGRPVSGPLGRLARVALPVVFWLLVWLLAALAGLGLPMACVALRDPYDLAGLPENVYGLAAYEYNIESLDTVAQALTGAFVPAGKLPVPLEGGQP